MVFIFDLVFINFYEFESKYDIDDKEFIGTVLDYDVKDNKIVIEVMALEKIIVTYKYYDKEFNKLSLGDKIKIEGEIIIPSERSNFNSFDYRRYLYNKGIYYLVEATSIDKIRNNDNYLYTFKNFLYEKIANLKSSDYIKTLLFCDNSLSKEVKDSYRINGISHLFSVSGMHINFFVAIIGFYLNKVTYNKRVKYLFQDIFIIFYIVLFPSASLLRSAIMSILYSINFIFKFKISKIDIMFLTLMISIFIDPFIIYDLGYIYSFVITFFLILFGSFFRKKNWLFRTIYISLLSFLVSIPITIYNSYEINVMSIFLNIFLVPIISVLILPLTVLTFVFPIFDDVLYLFVSIIEDISLFISSVDITKFIFSKPSIIVIVIYYGIFLLAYKNYKYIFIDVILLVGIYFYPYFNSEFAAVFFDVGQGDSYLLRYPFNDATVLIDTGNNEYRIKNDVIPYMKSVGIRKIDYLIITHGDSDHMREAIYLVDNFRVDNVIFNCGLYNDLENKFIEVLERMNIRYYSCVRSLDINSYDVYFLNNRDYGNENDNSNVIYMEFAKYKFLFMGDAGVEVEDDLLEKYNLRDVDILKVGHHGSKTSSSKKFIDEINPKYGVISVGKNNRYGHPNDSVLDSLKNSKIYRTDQDGSVMFKIKNNKLSIETCVS